MPSLAILTIISNTTTLQTFTVITIEQKLLADNNFQTLSTSHIFSLFIMKFTSTLIFVLASAVAATPVGKWPRQDPGTQDAITNSINQWLNDIAVTTSSALSLFLR